MGGGYSSAMEAGGIRYPTTEYTYNFLKCMYFKSLGGGGLFNLPHSCKPVFPLRKVCPTQSDYRPNRHIGRRVTQISRFSPDLKRLARKCEGTRWAVS